MIKTLLTTALTLSTSVILFAQTGPGGVGTTDGSSNLVLWLKANDINQISGTSVITWPDASGYGNDALPTANAPMYNDGQLFGNAVVNFSAASQQALYINNDPSFNTDYVSVFIIARLNSNSDSKGTFLIKTPDNQMSNGFGLLRLNSKEKIRFFAGDYGVNRDSEHIHYGLFDLITGNFRSSGANKKVTAMVNNAGGGVTVSGFNTANSENLFIGARPNNSGVLKSFLDGDIAEIVVLAKDLPSTERILISNYLAAKYGFAISNDKYAFHSTHPNDVIGIGKFKGVAHTKSQSGVFELLQKNSKPLVDGNFLMVGHDGGSMQTIITNLPDEYSQRFERTWRAHVNGVIKKERLFFHLDGVTNPSNIDDYALLLDYDGDGDFSNATVINANAYDASTNTVKFTNVELHTGAVFTLAMYKAITWELNSFHNGTGTLEAPGQGDGGRVFNVLSPGAVLSENASVYAVNVSPAASLFVDSAICFTINNYIHNDGVISIATHGSLIQRTIGKDKNTGSGNYIAAQVGLNNIYGYNNWSSPMKASALEDVFPDVNPCDLLTYSAFYQEWKYDFADGYATTCNGNPVIFNASHSIFGGDGIMNVGRGYFITGNITNPTKTFEGQINNGRITKLIVATPFGDHQSWNDDDWNLIGNPYPSALDPFAFWQENAIDNHRITDALYFWDDAGTQGAAYDQYNDYSSWNLTGGIASDNSSLIIDSLNHIGVGQGMMIWADTNGWDTIGDFAHGPALDTLSLDTIVFTNSMRSCNNTIFFKNQQSQKELVWLLLETPSGKNSKFLLGTVPGATDAIDRGYDARRVSYSNGVEFSSMVLNDTTSYSIQGIDPLDALNANKRISLKVVSAEGGLHTISRAAFETGGAPLKMYLRDNLLNVTHDLDNGNYEVYLSPNTRDITRFEILFEYDALNNNGNGTKGGVTSVEDLDTDFTISPIQNGFVISSTEGMTGDIFVYDVAGHVVYQENLNTVIKSKTVTLEHSTGMYIVKVMDQNNTFHTLKTVIE